MNKKKNFEPELGQGLFGNKSWLKFELPETNANPGVSWADLALKRMLDKLIIGKQTVWNFENKTIFLMPYNWDYEEEPRPNFIFKPENILISWYKYPFRSASSNKKLSPEKLKEIVLKSLLSTGMKKELIDKEFKKRTDKCCKCGKLIYPYTSSEMRFSEKGVRCYKCMSRIGKNAKQ